MEGWIKLHRKLSENHLWQCEPFTRGQAWVDLLMLANHTYGFFYLRDHKIEVERGQVGWSVLKLSIRWKWSRKKTQKYLNDLEKGQQIIQHKNNSTSIISIINYEEYQEKEQLIEQQKDNRKTTERQQKDTNKNNKNNKNVKNILLSELKNSDFENPLYYELTISFYELFKKNLQELNISTSKLEKSKGSWIEHIRLLIENDKRTVEELREVFTFLRNDSFWKQNILSTSKLREKFETLLIKSRSNAKNKSNNNKGCSYEELAEVVSKHFAVNSKE